MENNVEVVIKKSSAMKSLDRVGKKEVSMQSQQTPQSATSTQSQGSVQNFIPPATIDTSSKPDIDFDFNPPDVEAKTVQTQKEPDVKPEIPLPQDYDPADEVDALIDPKAKAGENFKKLRTKLKAVNTSYKEVTEEVGTLKTKLQQYESGLLIPEENQKLMQRISELEVYEKMYNIKGSTAYKEKVLKPLDAEMGKLKEIASEYGVGEDVVKAALNAKTRPEQNRILANYFDEIAAVEFKSILNNIAKINSEAAELEATPDKLYDRIQQESKVIEEQRAKERLESIANTSKDVWVESLNELRSSDKYPEFSFRENDNVHNEKLVRPLLTKSAAEYGKIINELAKHGLQELPRELSKALSRMTTLAHASAYWKHIAEQQSIEIEQLSSSAKRHVSVNRPSMNGGSVYSSTTPSDNKGSPAMRALSRVAGSSK